MKRFWFVTVVVVVGLALASTVQAISQGPGGRIYFTQRSGSYDQIWSIQINSNWDNVGLSPVAQVSHGQVLDCDTNMYHLYYGISPEIENPGQAPGFANLVMGLWYNGTPATKSLSE